MRITSNTIVKNGMPFIGGVLDQVAPFVSQMIITISRKTDDGTMAEIDRVIDHNRNKVLLCFEDVKSPGELTVVRQKQADMSTGDWIFFLDDDDWWPKTSLKKIIDLIEKDEDLDAYCFNPFQLTKQGFFDNSWWNKWFTKLFRNRDIVYKHPWPRDLIYKGNELLYWKKNPRVVKSDIPFFHLSYLKKHSFRNENWAKSFRFNVKSEEKMQNNYPDLDKIYDLIR